MTDAPKPRLPTEIIGLIVDDFDADVYNDRRALLACSYVNRAFAPIAQKRLFHDVTIALNVASQYPTTFFEDGDEDYSTMGEKLLRLLKDSPHIAPYIRNITVRNGAYGLTEEPPPGSLTSGSPDFPLYAIAALAINLEKVCFESGIWFRRRSPFSRHMQWSAMQSRMQVFLTQLIKRIPAIGLTPFEAVPMSIFHCSAVKELQISTMLMDTNAVPSYKVKLDYLDLQTVGIEGEIAEFKSGYQWSIWFNSPSSAFDLSGLRVLKTRPESSESPKDLFALCSRSLQSLHLVDIGGFRHLRYDTTQDDIIRDVAPEVDLGDLKALSELTISSTLIPTPFEFDFSTNLFSVFRVLKTLSCSTAPTLRVMLSITFGYLVDDGESGLAFLNSIPWPILLCSILKEDQMKAGPWIIPR